MKNPILRKELAENGTYGTYTATRRTLAKLNNLESLYKFNESTGELTKSLNGSVLDISDEEIQECENMRKCKNEQRSKIEHHVKFLFERSINQESVLMFGTFTFDDDALMKKADTRKQKVRRTLSKCADDFIMNIDYGTENEREHYHAIIEFDVKRDELYQDENGHWRDKEIDKLYGFGFYSLVPVRLDEDTSAEKLSRYLVKLVFHSVKVTQSYVSVKKGSRYQQMKKLNEQTKRLGRSKGIMKQVERMKSNYSQVLTLKGFIPFE